jgi:outer membrane receptor for ferrienterochelin and colicin
MEKRRDGSAHWNKEYYGTAIPQAYLSLGNQDLSLQLGHFYSVVGYEGVMAPNNFFYSKAYSYQFAGPFTHWGGQVNWNMTEDWTVQVGLHNGWDSLDRETNKMGVVAKATYTNPCSGAWSSFAITTGDEFNNSAGLAITEDVTNRTRYSWLFSVPVSCNTEYVFHHWLGFQEDGGPGNSDAEWYGVDQYLYYTINDCWKAGFRFEWFRDEEGTRVGLNRASNPNVPPLTGNFYSVTLGLNYQATENLTLRPELRGDWYDGTAATQPFDDGTDDSQFMLGFDAILLF